MKIFPDTIMSPCRLLPLVVVTAVLVIASCSQCREKTYVVGIINPSSGLEDVVRGFREGMKQKGYREGKNIRFLYNGPLGDIDRVNGEISSMLSRRVDLIYSLTTPVTAKLSHALSGKNVPGVFGPVFDPVDSGIVESLVSPGGHLTGVQVRGSTPKALEWLLAVVPGVRRIYVPFHFSDKAACQTLEDLRTTAAKFEIELVTADVSTEEDLENALRTIPENVDALWMTCSHLLFSNVDSIVHASLARKLPTASSTHSPFRNGILISYGENDFALGKQISRLADKVLKGTPPENLPVETADFVLGINLRTAASLGLNVPDSVLKQADFIVR